MIGLCGEVRIVTLLQDCDIRTLWAVAFEPIPTVHLSDSCAIRPRGAEFRRSFPHSN
jgi:hypothetical protein